MNDAGVLTWKQKLLLVVGGVIAACVIAELGLRIIRPQIFELHPPGMYQADSEIGYVLTPGFDGFVTRAEFRHRVTTGQAGLRGDDPRPRQNDSYRVLILGDSMAWGFGVEDGQTAAVQLEALLAAEYPGRDIQVLNGAVPGYGTADELAFLNARGDELRPDLVVVQFFSINDLYENVAPASEWADVSNGMLIMREGTDTAFSGLPQWIDIKVWLKSNSHLAAFLFDRIGYVTMRAGIVDTAPALADEDFSEEEAALGSQLLIELTQTARGLGADVLLLYTTGQSAVIRDGYTPLPSLNVVREAANAAQAAWVDAAAVLQQRPDRLELYYPLDGHWTAAGHRAIAELLAQEIRAMGLIANS